jgi:hypothetical protein
LADSALSIKTPRRNKDVEAAFEFWESIATWNNLSLNDFAFLIEESIRSAHNPFVPDDTQDSTPSVFTLTSDNVFVHVLPVMQALAKSRWDEMLKDAISSLTPE